MEHLLPPNSSGGLRSDTYQRQIIEGDADEDHTQIIGGIQSNYWGGYVPPSPPGFGTPAGSPPEPPNHTRGQGLGGSGRLPG